MTFIDPEVTIPGIEQWMEEAYQSWCIENNRDPDYGDSARAYEESLAQQPLEEWWRAMDDEHQYQNSRGK